MPYTNLTKPSQGDTTRKAEIDALIDNDNFFNSQLSVLGAVGVPNGSFETDGDSDGTPDEWTTTLYTGGAFTITGQGKADTENFHGQFAVKLTSPGGSGNGGGEIITDNFFAVTPGRVLEVSWAQKSSVTNIRNKVQVLFYSGAQALVSTVTVYTSITNPTSWLTQAGVAAAPSTARYAKIKLIGAENTTTVAGSAYFDDVRIRSIAIQKRLEIRWPDTTTAPSPDEGKGQWVVPDGVYGFVVECFGAGGGADWFNGGGGGGGGAYCWKLYTSTPGTVYDFELGLGGDGAASGTNGTDTTFDGLTAGGGAGSASGNGGAGGIASGGDENVDGTAGDSTVNPLGGAGGYNPRFGIRGAAATSATRTGARGMGYCAGGGGPGEPTNAGGDGSDGVIIISW